MNKFTKTMIAAALFAGAGAVNASLTTGSVTGDNEMFLSVYNPDAVNADLTLGLTYNLDLGITFNQLKANAGAAFGGPKNLTDANWTAFTGLITNPANVKYVMAVGAEAQHGGIVTGNSAVPANPIDNTVIGDPIGRRVNEHATEINAGLGAGNSSIIKDIPATPFTGQFTHDSDGLPVSGTWASWPHDPRANYNNPTGLWLVGWHLGVDGFGDPAPVLDQADVTRLGTVLLSGNTLTLTTTAVPLPAAVWLFGAGLMGMLRATRRKTA